MKKTVLILMTAALGFGAAAQTLKGTINSAMVSYAQLAPNEHVYYYNDNDSLYVYDDQLNLTQTFGIDSRTNCSARVSYVSRTLIDSDNAIEFIVTYDDTTQSMVGGVGYYDNGSVWTFPGLAGLSSGAYGYATVINTGSSADLLYRKYQNNQTVIVQLSGIVLLTKSIELEAQQANVYPNPATEIVKVPGVPGEVVNIYSMDGQLITQKQMQQAEESIKVDHLPHGSYLIKTSHGSTWKFVKQ